MSDSSVPRVLLRQPEMHTLYRQGMFCCCAGSHCTDKVCFVVVLAATVQTRYVLLYWQPLYRPGNRYVLLYRPGVFCFAGSRRCIHCAELDMFCCTDQVIFFVQTMCADCTVCHTQWLTKYLPIPLSQYLVLPLSFIGSNKVVSSTSSEFT